MDRLLTNIKDSAATAGVVSWISVAMIIGSYSYGWPSERVAGWAAIALVISLPALILGDLVIAALRALFAARQSDAEGEG